MTEYKMYIQTSKANEFIKLSISYNKDTYNWATGQPKTKGYQLTAMPVKRSGMIEEFGAFTGYNTTLVKCNRRSKKRLEIAIEELNKNIDKYLQYFINQGFKIDK
jgi:hypothetical protein